MMTTRRIDALRLAAKACISPRSAEKALREGAESLKGLTGERAANGMRELGLSSDCRRSEPPPQAA